jgi:bifunctional lysine-specific demethylase and histidyl-hydroxylase NO66
VHFDTTSIVVVQLDGTKTWSLWDQLVEMPNNSMAYPLDVDELGPPVAEFQLEPGDILYLPSGVPHSAHSLNHHSLHLGFAIQPISYLDVLLHGLKLAAKENPSLRRSILPCMQEKNFTSIANSLSSFDEDVVEQFYKDYKFSLFANSIPTGHNKLKSLAMIKKGSTQFRRSIDRSFEMKIQGEELRIVIPSQIIPEKPVVLGDPTYLSLPVENLNLVKRMLNGQVFDIELIESNYDRDSICRLSEIILDAGMLVAV